eukprot:IDg10888t1
MELTKRSKVITFASSILICILLINSYISALSRAEAAQKAAENAYRIAAGAQLAADNAQRSATDAQNTIKKAQQAAINAERFAKQAMKRRDAGVTRFTNDTEAIDFACSVPIASRLSSGCWLRGARGRIAGPRSKACACPTLGWRGLMIEGSPTLYSSLVRNRPEVVAVNAMVCSEPRDLHWIETANAVGGAWELMTEAFRRSKHPSLTEETVKLLPTVPCVTLSSILSRFGVVHVDLFSLDVEGAEGSVLKTLDFNNFSASVIIVEVRSGSGGVRQSLEKAGYVDYGKVGPNRAFLHPRFEATLPTPLPLLPSTA